jgi:uncharacterized membrane protein YfcA
MSLLALAAGVAVLTGAALQSSIGFGFALVAAPLLFAATSPPEAVGLMILLALELSLLTLLTEGRRPQPVWRDVWAVVGWSLPGSLAGVAVLRALDDLALQLLVTAGVLVALAVNLRAAHRAPAVVAHEPPSWGRPAAGIASGALSTSTSTGGPPIVLLLMSRGLRPGVVRDTLTATFVGSALVSTAALLVTSTDEAVPDAAVVAALVPLTALGQLLGRRVFARLAESRRYERVLTVVLLASIAVGLAGVVLERV